MLEYEKRRTEMNIRSIGLIMSNGREIPFLKNTPPELDDFRFIKQSVNFQCDFALYDNKICFASFMEDKSFIINVDNETCKAFKELFVSSFQKCKL